MNKKIKNIIARVLIGASMAVTVAGAGLISSNVQASASTGYYNPKFVEDHNKIQVQSWYYNKNGFNYKFKYEREDTAFVDLSYSGEYTGYDSFYLGKVFQNVIYNGAKSQTDGPFTLTRDNDGFLILTLNDYMLEASSANVKFYANDGNSYLYRNTNSAPSSYEGNGFTVAWR